VNGPGLTTEQVEAFYASTKVPFAVVEIIPFDGKK
jgi:hypothetical protein